MSQKSINLAYSVSRQPVNLMFLSKIKFLFAIIKLILVICVYLTYDENVFSGLNILATRGDDNYMKARAVLLTGISFFGVFLLTQLIIIITGFTYNFNKNNIIILSLDIFSIYLLCYFIFDGWHYVIIWYIFIVTQFPQTIMEVWSVISAIFNDAVKYRKLKNMELKPLKP